MRKQEFLNRLKKKLSGLSRSEIAERLGFYSEMIDDLMEDGLSEKEAVRRIGSVGEVAEQILRDSSVTKIKPQGRLGAFGIALLVLGSPIWLSLLIAAFAVIVSVYAVIWSAVISLWAAFGSLVGCAVGGAVGGIIFAVQGNALTGIATVGAAIACVGLSILFFLGCKAVTKGTLLLTRAIALGVKECFVKKEAK